MPKPFEKGHHIGRPKGSKDIKWAKVTTWVAEIEKSWPYLTHNQKAHYSLEIAKMLMSKMKALPVDPSDSKLNVDEAMGMLKQFESKSSDEVKKP